MEVDTPYADTVVNVLTDAFMPDPVVCWLFPETTERRQLQAGFYRSLLGHPAAEAHLVGHDGAAIWLTFTNGQALGGEPPQHDRLRALGEALAERHPKEPHLYLPCMGVVSTRQGAGIGSAMLRQRLERTDLPAYLEASSPRSRALYARHGFADLGEPVRVLDSPPLWPMWRPPEGTR